MKHCTNCGMNISDQEPFCPICGPAAKINEKEGLFKRASYAQRPRVIRLRISTLIVYDKHIFIILSIVAAVFTLGLLFIDNMLLGGWTWSRYTTAAILFIWMALILPYSFNQLRGDHYFLLFSTALSILLFFIDFQDAALTWAFIPSALFFVPSGVNCIIFSIKGS